MNSQEQTLIFAKEFATKLIGGDIIALEGELGAGKTVFVKGLAKGLEIKNIVRSPSFLIMKVYKIGKHSTIKNFCHIDAYRLERADELEAVGIGEYLGDKNTVCVIEWAQNVKQLFKNKKIISINIQILDENKRKIIIK